MLDEEEVVGSPLATDKGPLTGPAAPANPIPFIGPPGPNAGTEENHQL